MVTSYCARRLPDDEPRTSQDERAAQRHGNGVQATEVCVKGCQSVDPVSVMWNPVALSGMMQPLTIPTVGTTGLAWTQATACNALAGVVMCNSSLHS